jgi:hypothetical protein
MCFKIAQAVGLAFIVMFVLSGQGWTAATSRAGVHAAQTEVNIGDRSPFEAPSNWGTNRSEHFTFRYPSEYTADLDFDTREIVVTVRDGGEVVMRVQYFNSEDPVFVQVATDDPFFDQMIGSAEKK